MNKIDLERLGATVEIIGAAIECEDRNLQSDSFWEKWWDFYGDLRKRVDSSEDLLAEKEGFKQEILDFEKKV